MTRARTIWLGAFAAAAVAACGEDATSVPAAPAKRSIALTVRFDDGAGHVLRGTLACRPGEQRATGIARPAERSCSRVRTLAPFLIAPPPQNRACTQIYGGPQTARVIATIDRHRIDRRFSRTNGCQIADYDRVARAFTR